MLWRWWLRILKNEKSSRLCLTRIPLSRTFLQPTMWTRLDRPKSSIPENIIRCESGWCSKRFVTYKVLLPDALALSLVKRKFEMIKENCPQVIGVTPHRRIIASCQAGGSTIMYKDSSHHPIPWGILWRNLEWVGELIWLARKFFIDARIIFSGWLWILIWCDVIQWLLVIKKNKNFIEFPSDQNRSVQQGKCVEK